MKKEDISVALAFPILFSACLEEEEPVVPPRAYFVSPSAGETVPTELVLRFGVSGFVVKPAGAVEEGSGYLNLFVDVPCAAEGMLISPSANVIPLPGGQTEIAIALSVGPHSLCVQASNGAGIALPIGTLIEIVVVDEGIEIIAPIDGAAVGTLVPVYLHARGLVVEPSGVAREGAGHFTLALDRDCVAEGESVTGQPGVLNLAGGENALTLEVSEGPHTLCLGFADGDDVAMEFRDVVSFWSY